MAAAKLEVYQRVDGLWAWHLKAANGQVVATDGSQGYAHRSDALSMGTRVAYGDLMREDIADPLDPDDAPPLDEAEPES